MTKGVPMNHHCRMKKIILFALILILPTISQALCVNVKKANLRSGPSTKKQISWEVFKYMPLQKIKKQGSWYKVKDFEGDFHWVFKTIITSKYKCAVVKASKANLRTGPGTKFKKADDLPSVDKYTVFKLSKIKGKWAKVTDSFGDSYWISRKLVWIN